MKILYVVTGLGLGGAEKVVADLADQMVLLDHEVKIAYLKGDIWVKPHSPEIEIIYLGLESGQNFISASKKYRQLVKQYRPDVVHAHMVHANIFARLNRIGCKVPKLICTAHNSNEGGQIRMLAYRYTNFLSDFNTNVSKEAVDSFIQKKAFRADNLCSIYNGIDLVKFARKSSEQQSQNKKINALTIGRFNEQKDYPNLLNAVASVVQKYPYFHLNIVGDGELRHDIEQLIVSLGLEQFVTLLGRRDDVPAIMSQADLYILSSKYEGLPTVLIEAMAASVFVVATDCGGSKEVMGGCGILVPPRDSDALADAILQAIGKPDSEKVINNNAALAYVRENFDLNKVAQKWEQIYESE